MKTHHKNSERFVAKVFQDVFKKYDLMNDLMSFGIHRLWKKRFIELLNPQIKSCNSDSSVCQENLSKHLRTTCTVLLSTWKILWVWVCFSYTIFLLFWDIV